MTIAGNKADLEGSRRVKKEEVDSFAKEHKAVHFTVSAKNGAKVTELFQDIAERMQRSASGEKSGLGKRGGPKLTVERDGKKGRSQEKKEGCC